MRGLGRQTVTRGIGNHEIILRMVKDGDLDPMLDFSREAGRQHELAQDYLPNMNAPDAAIVRLSEIYPHHTVLTVDRGAFRFTGVMGNMQFHATLGRPQNNSSCRFIGCLHNNA